MYIDLMVFMVVFFSGFFTGIVLFIIIGYTLVKRSDKQILKEL